MSILRSGSASALRFALPLAVALVGCSGLLGLERAEKIDDNLFDAGSTEASASSDASSADAGGCPAGFAHCTADPSEECETNLMTDPDHCGRCEVSCRSQCNAGICSLERLRSNVLRGNRVIAVPGGAVISAAGFGGDNGFVEFVRDDGTRTALRDRLSDPYGLAFDGQHVYATTLGNPEAIVRVKLDGSDPGTIATDPQDPRGIAVTDTKIFYADAQDDRIRSLPKVPGSSSSDVGQSVNQPWDVKVSGAQIFFAEADNCNSSNGKIQVADDLSGDHTLISDNQFCPRSLAVTTTHIYWGNRGDGQTATGAIMRIARGQPSTTPPDAIASAQIDVIQITADDTHVYWLTGGGNAGAGALHRAELDGTNPITVADRIVNPVSLAASDTHVYILDRGDGSGDGTLWRLPK